MRNRNLIKAISKWNRERLDRRRESKARAKQTNRMRQGFVILTPPHCLTLAKDIAGYLAAVGKKARITTDEKKLGKGIAIVICPQIFKNIPKQHICIQMEQTVSSRWFTEEYIARLKDSLAVIEYSTHNIPFLLEKGIPFGNIFYCPIIPGAVEDPSKKPKSTDVLFYGDINNERRRAIIEELSNHFQVKVISNTFGQDLIDELRNAKVVINIHYYEGALLESVRLSEAVRFGAVVVSERAADSDSYNQLTDIIDFVDVGDVSAMTERIAHWLVNEPRRARKVEDNQRAIRKLPEETKFHFLRTLLALDFIDFEQFYAATRSYIQPDGGRICLGLPESLSRRAAFLQENTHGFQIFPGLRHSLGWVGCGMSYKYLMRRALESNLEQITICEDDVGFAVDHEKQINLIQRYLHGVDWDIFSGFMADVDKETDFSETVDFEGRHLFHMNKMVSTVFNIYNKSFFHRLENWNESDVNPAKNTIDRFIQAQPGLKVITSLPFLVEHKEELDSTIWGFRNTQYNQMVENSLELLRSVAAERDPIVRKCA